LDALKYLIKVKHINLSPDDRLGGTPLADAIRHKHPEAQKLLRDRGAHLGSMDISVRLCEAGATNDVETLATFQRNGANFKTSNYGQRTALHLASSNGHLAAVGWILENIENINVNQLDRMRHTPLDDAIREGHEVCALLLKSHGGVLSSDENVKGSIVRLTAKLKVTKAKTYTATVAKAFTEAEEVLQHGDLDKTVRLLLHP